MRSLNTLTSVLGDHSCSTCLLVPRIERRINCKFLAIAVMRTFRVNSSDLKLPLTEVRGIHRGPRAPLFRRLDLKKPLTEVRGIRLWLVDLLGWI